MKDQPAYPHRIDCDKDRNRMFDQYSGLTKREAYAIAAMQGMLSHATRYKPRNGAPSNWHDALAQEAVEIADALLAALEATK